MPGTSVIDHREKAVAEAIASVQRAAYAVEAEMIGFDAIPPLHETVDDIEALDLVIIGAHDHRETLVGLVGYRRHDEIVEIDRLAVSPQCHRAGLGTRLMEAVHHREQTARSFDVSTGALNRPAIRLYTRLGYEQREVVRLTGGPEIVRLRRESGASREP